MPISEVHKVKRKKNLAVLAALFLFCTAIFIVTMIKMAKADEDIFNAYLGEREQHQIGSDKTVKKWRQDYAAKGVIREEKHKQTEKARTTHQDAILSTGQDWVTDWEENIGPERQKTTDQRNIDRKDHQQSLEPRPESWWVHWKNRTTKDNVILK